MSARRLRIVGCLLSVALAACAAAPEYHTPKPELPARWSEAPESVASTGTADPRWWRTFNDRELDSLVERALQANPDLQGAEARGREARARLGAATAPLWPSLDARGSVTRERESENAPSPVQVRPDGTIEAPGQPENIFQAGFDAKWELDLFGGARQAIEATRAEAGSAFYDRGAVLVTLVAEVSRNYIALRGYQQQRRVAREMLTNQEETLTLARARQAAGMATELDVAQAEVQRDKAAAIIPPLEISCAKALHRLGVLVGETAGALATELEPEGPIPVSSIQPQAGIPSDLMRMRPDILSAERRLRAASARAGAAKADLYPKFTIFGTAGLASTSAADFFNGASTAWSVGPSVSWPIFQRGRIVATIRVRDAQQQLALIAYRQAILSGIEDVENALAAFRQNQARRAAVARGAEAEERSLHFARERYLSGLTDLREVLDAQRGLFLARRDLVQSDTDLSLDLVALYKALGGGWTSPSPADRQPDDTVGPGGDTK